MTPAPTLIAPREIFPDNLAAGGFLTPTPFLMQNGLIRVFGGMRDHGGISRIGWFDVDPNGKKVVAVCDRPVIELGIPGSFDSRGMILGDIFFDELNSVLCMSYVGFSAYPSIKFRAFTGLAMSFDQGMSFVRVSLEPIFGADVLGGGTTIAAVHDVSHIDETWSMLIAIGKDWEQIGSKPFPRYSIHEATGPDLNSLQISELPIIENPDGIYRLGRPRREENNGYPRIVATGGKVDGDYRAYAFPIESGTYGDPEAPYPFDISPGCSDFAKVQSAYPARIDLPSGESWIFFNGDNMGKDGVLSMTWMTE